MGDEPEKHDVKGKGKARDSDSGPDPGSTTTSGSGAPEGEKTARETLSHMVQSAASFLMSGPPSGLAGTSEKGGTSTSLAGEALARAAESSVHLRPNAGPSGQATTIRTGHTEEHIAREEASFAAFLDSSDAPALSEPSHPSAVLQPTAAATHPVAATTEDLRTWGPTPRSVEEQQARDGADVVALLEADDPLDEVFEQVNEPAATMADVEALRRALFSSDSHSGISWDNVLNFIPDYLQASQGSFAPSGGDLSMHLGTDNPQEAWDTWINQWSRVLTNYQDEVWGDLGDLVAEARAEIERIKLAQPDEKPPEPKALLRLRAILGHLRGASSS
ncbi:hypothetical protein VTJ04DRAFT_3037 [Mycothermus thermophilus]|uniref:uncharacterized protein n=1 Tax=Humicola insolens TaxID=85995 RepID=UPI0037433653